MAEVPTLSGTIDTSEFGFTLPHEHFWVTDEGLHFEYPDLWDWDEVIQGAIEEVEAAQERGVRTLFEPTCVNIGRDIHRALEVVGATGIQVVPATGLYTFTEVPMYFADRSIDELAEFFIKDIEEGIQGTGINAGFLKCSADEPGVTEGVETVHRAVARAHNETGVPIMAHSSAPNRTGSTQLDVFESEGVDLEVVTVAHSGDSDDLDYLRSLADRGAFLGMDRFGIQSEEYISNEKRIDTVVRMCEAGYTDQMMLSHDHCTSIDLIPEDEAPSADTWNFRYLSDTVLPELRQRGVSDRQIEVMTEENPARWFEI